MSSSFSTTQNQRRDAGSPNGRSVTSSTSSASSGPGGVVPGTKTSGQEGKEITSSSPTFPAGSTANPSSRTPNSPQPSPAGRSSSPASQRSSSSPTLSAAPPNDSSNVPTRPTRTRDGNSWYRSLEGSDVPEEVKAIVKTGMHAWSRGIGQKVTVSVARS